MIIRAQSFEAWMKANFDRSTLNDIATHGADAGYAGLTWTTDTVKLFDRFGPEIWDMAYEDAQDYGADNVPAFIATFRRNDMSDSLDTFKNLMVWYAAERIANQLTNN